MRGVDHGVGRKRLFGCLDTLPEQGGPFVHLAPEIGPSQRFDEQKIPGEGGGIAHQVCGAALRVAGGVERPDHSPAYGDRGAVFQL